MPIRVNAQRQAVPINQGMSKIVIIFHLFLFLHVLKGLKHPHQESISCESSKGAITALRYHLEDIAPNFPTYGIFVIIKN